MRSTSSRHGAGVQAFHWLTVMLVLVAYVLSKGDHDSLYSAAADGLRRIHEALGVLVFVVVMLRLLWRLIDSTPAKRPMPRWMAAAAKLVHFALYALLIAIPTTAVLGTWLEGIPATLPGFDIAPQIPEAHGLGQLIMEMHATLAERRAGSRATSLIRGICQAAGGCEPPAASFWETGDPGGRVAIAMGWQPARTRMA